MEERRRLERFELNVPARVLAKSGSSKTEEYDLATRDLSSAGAYLYSSQPLLEGTSVKMEFLISFGALKSFAGDNRSAQVKVKGQVIRSDSNGIAIRFDSRYKITALESYNSKNGVS